MPARAMNNFEKTTAKVLKSAGFTIFWEDHHRTAGEYWAIHPALVFQYALSGGVDMPLKHLLKKKSIQLSLF